MPTFSQPQTGKQPWRRKKVERWERHVAVEQQITGAAASTASQGI